MLGESEGLLGRTPWTFCSAGRAISDTMDAYDMDGSDSELSFEAEEEEVRGLHEIGRHRRPSSPENAVRFYRYRGKHDVCLSQIEDQETTTGRKEIYKHEELHEKLEDIMWEETSFLETQATTCSPEEGISDVNDDLQRELYFYTQVADGAAKHPRQPSEPPVTFCSEFQVRVAAVSGSRRRSECREADRESRRPLAAADGLLRRDGEKRRAHVSREAAAHVRAEEDRRIGREARLHPSLHAIDLIAPEDSTGHQVSNLSGPLKDWLLLCRRKQREAKKANKELQAERLKEKAQAKKQSISQVDRLRKQRQRSGFAGELDMDAQLNAMNRRNPKDTGQRITPGNDPHFPPSITHSKGHETHSCAAHLIQLFLG